MSLASKADKAASALSQLENSTIAKTADDLRAHIGKYHALATSEWVSAFGDLDSVADDPDKLAALVKALKAHLSKAPTDVASELRKAVSDAQRLGVEHAQASIPGRVHLPALTVPHDITNAVDRAPLSMTEKLTKAAQVLDALDANSRFSDVLPSVSLAGQSVTALTNAATYVVNAASNDAVSTVATANNTGTVYVGERDGCLDCNANVGHTSVDGYEAPPPAPELPLSATAVVTGHG